VFHLYGIVWMTESMLTGCRGILQTVFTVPGALATLSKEGVTVFPTVPPMLRALGEGMGLPHGSLDEARGDLSALRLILSSAAPLSREIVSKFRSRFGPIPLYDAYGTSETSGPITCGPLDRPPRPDSVGLPLDGVSVEIRDEASRRLEPGQQGEIWVRSPGVMRGYYRDDEATQKAIVDGWYRTGDLGYLDQDGYLYITDRTVDVVNVAGMKVYPREVEDAIRGFDGVRDVVVARTPHAATGETPIAHVLPAEGAEISIASLVKFLRARLAPHKIPTKIELVSELPILPSGKVRRANVQPKTT